MLDTQSKKPDTQSKRPIEAAAGFNIIGFDASTMPLEANIA
jgi:hypothetical protein